MFHRSILAAAALATLVGGAAIAQGTPPQPPTPAEPGKAPPPPPPPPPGHGPDGMRGMGPGGMPPGGPLGMRPMPMGKGTFVSVSKDGSVVVKCADDESTKACMEAAGPLIDKVRPRP